MCARRRIWQAVAVTAVGVLTGSPSSTTAKPSDSIAFSRWRNGSAQVYVVAADGTRLRRVTPPGPWEDSHPDWSRDGTQIVFARRNAKGWRLFVTGLTGSVKPLTTAPDQLANHPSWSPKGRWIVFERLPAGLPETGCWAQQLYIVGQDGRGLSRLTAFDRFAGGAGGAHWSADGSRIVFWGEQRPSDGFHPDTYVMRADGSGTRRLIPNAADPVLSPDGRKIAFSRGGEIYVANQDGSAVRRLTRTRVFDSEPTWSPDSRHIAFSSLHRWKGEISVVGVDGAGVRRLTRAGADVASAAADDAPAWRP